jgi:hypothetical protein
VKQLAALLALPLLVGAAAPEPDLSAANVRAHITYLAGDSLRGREAGTPQFDLAARYVAAQMKGLGLQPMGGDGTFFQPVPLVAFRTVDQGALSLKSKTGGVTRLVFGKDYLVGGNPLNPKLERDAPLVFVGFGLVAPEHGRDDYRGLDVKGKIVVALSGAPKFLQTEERAYYRNARVKLAAAEARGAVGFVSVNTLTGEKLYPFANAVRQYQSWGMTWRKPDGKPFMASSIPTLATVSVAGAHKLLGAGHRTGFWPPPKHEKARSKAFCAARFAACGACTAKSAPWKAKMSWACLPGTDPRLKNEYVVLSAHLDHIGVTPPVKGRCHQQWRPGQCLGSRHDFGSGAPAARQQAGLCGAPVLFLIDTAEEKGLIGAEYFARNPPVPKSAIVANVDLDMPILTYDFTDVVAFGADRSSIGPSVKRAAARMNVKLSPDPTPDEGLFTRSDHYRFVEQGVPAVFLATGYANGGEAATKLFMAEHYHKPSDDLSQPIRYDTAAKFARLNYEITRELADGPRPSWNKGDFFAAKFGEGALS